MKMLLCALGALLLTACVSLDGMPSGGALRNGAAHFSNGSVRQLVRAGLEDDTRTMAEAVALGADVNAVGDRQVTPLILVMAAKKRNAFKFLIEHGADPNWQVLEKKHEFYGESALSLAAQAADSWYLMEILRHGRRPDIVNPADLSTPLWTAALAGKLEAVKLLINAGANLDHQDRSRATPMLVAAASDRYDIVYELLSAGANPDIPNIVGRKLKNLVEESLAPNRGLVGEMRTWCLKVKAKLEEQSSASK